jgi:nitrite reductase (NADH) large subunit
VVPRVPGGDITPGQLILIGEVARDFGLYTKITGGQRIDMFGATVDQLPEIWRRLVDGGMESGHAYGKALRTVKSCVGSDWCRYGQRDSVQMASTSNCATAVCAPRTRSRWGCRAVPATARRRAARTSA